MALKLWKKKTDEEQSKRVRFDPLRFDLSDEDEARQAAQEIKAEAERRRLEQFAAHQQWDFCRAFIFMQQWQTYDPSTKRFWDTRSLSDSWGYCSPEIYESVRYLISRMASNMPRIGFVPRRDSDTADRAAKSAEAMLEYLDSANETERKELAHSFDLAAYGTTIGEVYLQRDAKILDTTNEAGKAVSESVHLANHRILDPYRFYPDPGADDLSTCRDVLRQDYMHVDAVEELYGERLEPERIEPERRPGVFRAFGRSLVGEQLLDGYVNIHTYYVRGCKRVPKGLVVVSARDKILKHGPGILENGQLPFFMWRYLVEPRRFWGIPYVLPQIPATMAQNILYTSILTSALRQVSELWAIPAGTKMDESFFNRVRPKAVHMIGDQFPQNLANQIKFIGNELEPLTEALRRHRDNAAAHHDVNRGVSDENFDTLGQTQIAEEKDLVSLETSVRERREAYREMAKMRLHVQKKHGSPVVSYVVVGRDRPYDYKQWKATDYNDELECFVYPDSGTPRTAAAKLQLFERMVDKGLLPPEALAEASSRVALARIYAGGATTDTVFRDYTDQQNVARNENLKLAQGIPQVVSAADIHKAHRPCHRAQFYDREWRNEASTFEVLIHFDHIVMHEVKDEEADYLKDLSKQPPDVRMQLADLPFKPVIAKPFIEELELLRRGYLRDAFSQAGYSDQEIDTVFQEVDAQESERDAEEQEAEAAAAQPQQGQMPQQAQGPPQPQAQPQMQAAAP